MANEKIIIGIVVLCLNISGWIGIQRVGAGIFGGQTASSSNEYDDESGFRISYVGRGKSQSVQILEYLGDYQTVEIPSVINELPVTSIEREAFLAEFYNSGARILTNSSFFIIIPAH